MKDHHTQQRQEFIRKQTAHALKVADAIAWLRARNRYCLDLDSDLGFYKPAFGVPLEPRK